MRVRLYKPISYYLLKYWGNDPRVWEKELSKLAGFKVKLPRFFWEVHLFVINNRLPRYITMECKPEKDWFSVFYSYNMKGDLKKYLQHLVLKKCKKTKHESLTVEIKKTA